MNKAWLKELAHKCFLLFQFRPFIALIFLMLVTSTRLMTFRIMAACLLVFCFLSTATCMALGLAELRVFGSRPAKRQSYSFTTKEMPDRSRPKECQSQNCACVIQTEDLPVTSCIYQFAQTLRQASLSSILFVKMYLQSNLSEAGFFNEGIENDKPFLGTEQPANSINFTKLGETRENTPAMDEEDDTDSSPAHGSLLHSDFRCEFCHAKTLVSTQGLLISDTDCKIQRQSAYHSSQEGDSGDIPDLEDCPTPSEEEEVCKKVFETTTHQFRSLSCIATVDDSILQPTNRVKSATTCPSEDEHSIEKHQILPVEGCEQCRFTDLKKTNAISFPDQCICKIHRYSNKAEITDAELQKAASEYYTLEGDVLWCKADMNKQRNVPADTKSCEFCKREGHVSQKLSVFSLRTWTGAKTLVQPPANSKALHYCNAERHGVDEILSASAEESNQDAVIDRELRAIARSNRGESSKYMSTVGSFRDYAGSFRELGSFWSENGTARAKEDEFVLGCCDDHGRPCMLHSKSRSKVLQRDPLLSKTSLIREQDIMDVLWQECDDDWRQRQNSCGKCQKEVAQKQGAKLGLGSTDSFADIRNEGRTYDSLSASQSDYVLKFNRAADYGDNSCRFGHDKPCWTKTRGYQRRKHFEGLCKLFREMGLKQCMQRSKVDS